MSDAAQHASPASSLAPVFSTVAEGDLTLDDHEALAAMLARTFDAYDHWYAGARSWAGMQPELRVVARDGDVVVAHAGLRRQFVTVGETDLLVTAVGMVAVSPAAQGTGLGGELLRQVDAALERLGSRFGLLETGEAVQGFYRGAGWLPLGDDEGSDPVTGHAVTGHYTAFSADGAGVLVSQDEGWLIREVGATAADWPAGDIRWNGQMV
ncbi:GNAT family N-acetyltransferase [Frigoribacterium sp. VKM Ac-2530]|uniref:GNAT family N-acetyltransferase n=1 Tax=Frigoribacterium sp. VKM Ac-2530 TaxID=2783822 RepID=UPI00188CCBB5|nr:GNAT family N-acetyltransferase [Frigoribacterium sp. VKM Ac-2530]MBF4579657.1 GNAT family N-acetyltransferase [Frigoribacterium sp. VKM Ac-2530]